MPIEILRTIAENEAAESRLMEDAVEKIEAGLRSLANRTTILVEDRNAHRIRANSMIREHRDTHGKAERLEAVLIEIAKTARVGTNIAALKQIAQLAEKAVAEERKRAGTE